MRRNDAHFAKLALFCGLLFVLANSAAARTRYEEFETHPTTGVKLCNKLYEQVDSTACRSYCETETDLATGGCDCKTLKCVCANMQLDFCNFQKIRLHI